MTTEFIKGLGTRSLRVLDREQAKDNEDKREFAPKFTLSRSVLSPPNPASVSIFRYNPYHHSGVEVDPVGSFAMEMTNIPARTMLLEMEDSLKEILDNLEARTYDKNGLRFTYYTVKKEHAWFLTFTNNAGMAIARYDEESEKWSGYPIVVEDFFEHLDDEDQKLLTDGIAVHEYGELLFGDHHEASILEFAAIHNEGRLREYLGIIEKHYNLKMRDVVLHRIQPYVEDIVEERDYKVGAEIEIESSVLNPDDSARALRDGFRWPSELHKKYRAAALESTDDVIKQAELAADAMVVWGQLLPVAREGLKQALAVLSRGARNAKEYNAAINSAKAAFVWPFLKYFQVGGNEVALELHSGAKKMARQLFSEVKRILNDRALEISRGWSKKAKRRMTRQVPAKGKKPFDRYDLKYVSELVFKELNFFDNLCRIQGSGEWFKLQWDEKSRSQDVIHATRMARDWHNVLWRARSSFHRDSDVQAMTWVTNKGPVALLATMNRFEAKNLLESLGGTPAEKSFLNKEELFYFESLGLSPADIELMLMARYLNSVVTYAKKLERHIKENEACEEGDFRRNRKEIWNYALNAARPALVESLSVLNSYGRFDLSKDWRIVSSLGRPDQDGIQWWLDKLGNNHDDIRRLQYEVLMPRDQTINKLKKTEEVSGIGELSAWKVLSAAISNGLLIPTQQQHDEIVSRLMSVYFFRALAALKEDGIVLGTKGFITYSSNIALQVASQYVSRINDLVVSARGKRVLELGDISDSMDKLDDELSHVSKSVLMDNPMPAEYFEVVAWMTAAECILREDEEHMPLSVYEVFTDTRDQFEDAEGILTAYGSTDELDRLRSIDQHLNYLEATIKGGRKAGVKRTLKTAYEFTRMLYEGESVQGSMFWLNAPDPKNQSVSVHQSFSFYFDRIEDEDRADRRAAILNLGAIMADPRWMKIPKNKLREMQRSRFEQIKKFSRLSAKSSSATSDGYLFLALTALGIRGEERERVIEGRTFAAWVSDCIRSRRENKLFHWRVLGSRVDESTKFYRLYHVALKGVERAYHEIRGEFSDKVVVASASTMISRLDWLAQSGFYTAMSTPSTTR